MEICDLPNIILELCVSNSVNNLFDSRDRHMLSKKLQDSNDIYFMRFKLTCHLTKMNYIYIYFKYVIRIKTSIQLSTFGLSKS